MSQDTEGGVVRGRPSLWAVGLALLIAAAGVLAWSAIKGTFAAGPLWAAVILSAAAAALALVSLRRR